MRHGVIRWTSILLSAALACGLAWRFHRRASTGLAAPATQMAGEPRLMLWAWESPEDLRDLDISRAGVAFLSRELLVGERVELRPRRQPLRVPDGTWLMAVVRIEAQPGFGPGTVEDMVRDIMAAAESPNVRGLQIDFDATLSQRVVYATVLRQVRADLPPVFPLSITALTSWCGPNSWLQGLPVDEAVPMFFRMGGPSATRAEAPKDTQSIVETACAGSLGVATDETRPPIHALQRVYVFRPGTWTAKEIAQINGNGYEGLWGDKR